MPPRSSRRKSCSGSMRRPNPARRRSSAGCCGWNRRAGPSTVLRIRRSTRDQMVVAAIALVCAAASVSPAVRPIRGLSLDILTALRWEMFGRRHDPAASPTVVVAIDEESLHAAPFKGSPMLTWTGEIGRVLGAVAGRRRQGGRLRRGDPEFDRAVRDPVRRRHAGREGPRFRPRLSACAGRGLRPGKVVLGEMLRGNQPVRPSPGQRIAVRQQQNIRPLNISYRPRRHRAPPAADVYRQRGKGALDGGRTGVAGHGRRARIRQQRKADAGRLPDSRPGAEHDDAEFRGRRGRHSDLLVCRSAQLRRQERQGLFSALVRRQGRHLRHRSRCRRPPDDVEALCDRHRGRARATLRRRQHSRSPPASAPARSPASISTPPRSTI